MIEGGSVGKWRSGWVRSGASCCALWLLPATFALVACMAGCGAPAAPQPPTLNLPQPVNDLTASRMGDTVHVTFTVPQKTTDKLPVRGQMTARLCRGLEAETCQAAGSLEVPATQKTAAMDDTLPPVLNQGAPRLLVYRVIMQNSGGKSAAPSAPAFAVAGASPLPVAAFTVTPRRDGILLGWKPADAAGSASWMRVDRVRTAGPPSPAENAQRSPEEPADQSLHVPDADPSHPFALDATARTDRSYRYTAQRVERLTLSGHSLEVISAPTPPVDIAYRDVFPPRTPAGLVSAVDTPGKAIDLSWNPDVDTSLAGYIVYRRIVSPAGGAAPAAAPPVRISPAKPVLTPAWRDSTVLPGERYAYSVSAIDASGNESPRSAEVEDGLIAAGPHP